MPPATPPAAAHGLRWGRLSVGQKIAAIPTLFILALAGMLWFNVAAAEGQKLDSVIIDVAARQRGLLRQQLGEVLLASQGHPADYRTPRQLLDSSVETLKDGGRVHLSLTDTTVTVPGAPTPAIRDKLDDEEAALARFAEAADELLRLGPTDPAYEAQVGRLRELADAAEREANEAVKAYSADSREGIESMIRWEVVIAAAVAALGIAASWLIARGILNPLARVVDQSQRIAGGDLSGEPLRIRSADEIGQLADVFNRMLLSLRELSRQIRSATESVNSASAEILASAQQQAAGTKEQAATVQEITSTMQEITRSGRQIIEKAEQVTASAEAASAASASGLSAVQGTTRTMDTIREQVEEVAENIVALSEKTQAVGEIISTVNDIAEQSNLLALNASIEAAGAGGEGHRFSVVASEMKHLADHAKRCTVQVRSILGDIQKGINTSVMLTEEAVKRVESGRRQAATSEETIREMNATTEESIQTFEQIIGAANQQQIGFEQVTQGMQDIRQATEQTAQGTSQLEQAVASLGAMSQQLRAAVGRYRLESEGNDQ